MYAGTISEQILSRQCGHQVYADDVAICGVDCILGTDGSGPMAIDYFEQMGGTRLFDPARVYFSLDHYAPANTPETQAFHERIRAFARRFGATVFEVGDGISHQIVLERGVVQPGDLVIGADSHTVTCGAVNAFAIGVGSSDLAAAMLTGQIWLRVPQTIRIVLRGRRAPGVSAKDVALALVGRLGSDAANYRAIEFTGDGLSGLDLDDRLVLANLMVEAGAKAAIFPFDEETEIYARARGTRRISPVVASTDARYAEDIACDVSSIDPQIARPHSPDNVASVADCAGVRVQMVFLGTCTGGRVSDFHDALEAFRRAGGHIAAGLQLVLTPASRDVRDALDADGTLAAFIDAGAIVTETGCGACCGTSGVIPGDGMTVLSTANRNFKARMGNRTAEIYLASPAVCGAAAAIGRIPERP